MSLSILSICLYVDISNFFNMDILRSGMTLATLRYTVIILKNVIFVFMSCWSTVQWSMIMQQKYTLYMECSIPSFHSIEPCTALEKIIYFEPPLFYRVLSARQIFDSDVSSWLITGWSVPWAWKEFEARISYFQVKWSLTCIESVFWLFVLLHLISFRNTSVVT